MASIDTSQHLTQQGRAAAPGYPETLAQSTAARGPISRLTVAVLIFAVLALLTVSGLYVTCRVQAASRFAVVASDEVWRAEIGAYRQTSEMHELAMDLRFFAASSSLAGWLASGDASARAELEKDFLALATTNSGYDQIRYLDGNGREIIRVDRDGGKLVAMHGDQLQDKSDRYYFTESLKQRPGQIYISPLDLNVEHGAIEQPIKPTWRLGAPVFDGNGHAQGVVILNYNARDLLNRLRKLTLAGNGDPWLLDKAGYWMIGPPDAEWAFMYPDRLQRTFAQAYPEAWQKIVIGPASGQFITQGDLLTYAKVPFPSDAASHERSLGAGQADADWARIFLAVVPADKLSELKREVARPFLAIGAFLLPLFGFAAFAGTDQYARRRAAEFQREESEIRVRGEKLASVILEQRVTERTAELQASNRELEAFCYSVSHDLRSPLRVIDGFSQILEQDCGPHIGDSGKDNLARIRKGAQRMGGLIDDLLNLSRISRYDLNRKEVDLSAQVREVLEKLNGLAPERQVELAIADGIKVHGDARLLRIAIDNLIGNAWKFTQDRVPARIEFGQTEIDGKMAYYVRDDGAGFDMQYAGKLFGAFQRLHNGHEFAGHGIGLAIVQRVIVKHGGRVWAKAQPEQGATFYFTL